MFQRKFSKEQLQGVFYFALFLGFVVMFISSTFGLINQGASASSGSGFGMGANTLLGSFIFSGLVCGLFIHSYWRKRFPINPETQADKYEKRFIKAWQKAAKKQAKK